MGDRWRERGLDMMMAGKLEIDTEDELFKVRNFISIALVPCFATVHIFNYIVEQRNYELKFITDTFNNKFNKY